MGSLGVILEVVYPKASQKLNRGRGEGIKKPKGVKEYLKGKNGKY